MELVTYWKKAVLENYANFNGRSRRSEVLWFALANIIIYVVLAVLATGVHSVFAVVYLAFGLAMLVPSLAAGVRRLHDTGKSGWMLLIALIPIVGSIILLVFYLTDSQRGTNQYGPSEKYPA